MDLLGVAWRNFRHFLLACDEHSLHSPFLYRFYTNVIKNKGLPDDFVDSIETERQHLLRDHRQLAVTDFGAGSIRSPFRKISQIARNSLNPTSHSTLLYHLVKYFKFTNIVELGTSLGINTLYFSRAVNQGKIWTVEGCPQTAGIAQNIFRKLNRDNVELVVGNLDHVLVPLIKKLPEIDFVFFDANHRYEPTLRYYQQLKSVATGSSVFVFDDIYWSGEMYRAWRKICLDPQVGLSLEFQDLGMIFFRRFYQKQHFILR